MNGKGRARHSERAGAGCKRRRRARSDAPYLAQLRNEFIGLRPLRSGAWSLLMLAATRQVGKTSLTLTLSPRRGNSHRMVPVSRMHVRPTQRVVFQRD